MPGMHCKMIFLNAVNFGKKGVCNMQFSTLAHAHGSFLDLVGSHGTGQIGFAEHDGFVEIVINNPSKRNAISGKMMKQFAGVVDHITALNEVNNRIVGMIIRGTGTEAFCAGADLNLAKEIVNTPEKGSMMSSFMTDALNRLRQCNLISVTCLNGPALGGGAEICTTTDFRMMSADEKVYIQFVHAKIGASPGWGGARRLTNIVGRKHALKVCAGSAQIRATEALEMGFVDALVTPHSNCNEEQVKLGNYGLSMSASMRSSCPDDYFREVGRAFLEPYLKQAYPGSVRAIKTSIAATEDLSSTDAKNVEATMFKQRWCSADNTAALGAKK